MAESGLSVQLSDLRTAIAEKYHGGSGDYASLSTDEQNRVIRVLKAGLRMMYNPPRVAVGLNGRRVSHSWSFLWITTTVTHLAPYSTGTVSITDGVVTLTGGTVPSNAASCFFLYNGTDYSVSTRDSSSQFTLDDTTLDTVSGVTGYTLHQDDYDLPDNFGHIVEDSITYPPSANWTRPIVLLPEGRIRELRSNPAYAAAAYPTHAAVRAKENVEATGTRSEILFWPAVQAQALVTYKYKLRVPHPTDATDYVPGASDHSETILAACLAAGERMYDGIQNGPEMQHFLQCLEASVDFDRQNNRGHDLGYNGDAEPGDGCGPRHPDVGYVTYG